MKEEKKYSLSWMIIKQIEQLRDVLK